MHISDDVSYTQHGQTVNPSRHSPWLMPVPKSRGKLLQMARKKSLLSKLDHPYGELQRQVAARLAKWREEHVHNIEPLKTRRRKLRSEMTPAEAAMWKMLQRSQVDGRKFRRQHSVGDYILDFYCPAEKLAIELDGAGHFDPVAQFYDLDRKYYLEAFRIRVLRFENKLVFQSPERVIETIRANFGWADTPRLD